MSTATKTRRSKRQPNEPGDRVTIEQTFTVVRPTPPMRTEMVRLDQIERDGQNHRLEGPENKRKVTELAASFAPGPRAQLEPIRVYERDAGEPGPRYLLGFGFRRCAAAELAGWTEIRAEILPMPGDRSEIERDRAVENLQRHDLNPMEETVAVTNYLDGLPDLVRSAAHGGQLMPSRDASGKPTPAAVEQAAAELGRPTSWIRDRCYLLRLGPKVRKLVINGKLLLGHAREIAKLGDHAVQERLAQMCRVEDDGTCRTTLGQLRRWVGEHERSLKVVPWRLDADFAGAKDKRICGACATCPHNSANDRQLFEHDDAAALVGEGLCLNDACFEAKQAACNRAVEKAVATIVKKELPATEASAERVAAPFVKPGRVAREAKKAKDEGRTPDAAAAEQQGGQEETAETRDPTPEEQAQADLDTATEKWIEESSDALLEAVKRSPLYLACLILFEKVVRDTWELSEADVTGNHARAFELLARGDESAVRELASLIELGEHNDLDDLGVIADLPESAVDMLVRGWKLPVVPRPTLSDFLPAGKAATADALPTPEKPEGQSLTWHQWRPLLDQAYRKLLRKRDLPVAEEDFEPRGLVLDLYNRGLKPSAAAEEYLTHLQSRGGPDEDDAPDAKCRVCGCTEDDCSQCVDATGATCHWVDDPIVMGDLCSRCKPAEYGRRASGETLHRAFATGVIVGQGVNGGTPVYQLKLGDEWTTWIRKKGAELLTPETPADDDGSDDEAKEPDSSSRIGGLTWNRDKGSSEWWATNTAGMEGDADVLLDFVVSPPPGNEGGWVIDMSGADLLPVNFPESFETEQKAKAYCEKRNAELAAKGREQMPEAKWQPAPVKAKTVKVDADVAEVLRACTFGDKQVFLPPGQLDRRLYERVNKVLELLGGKWSKSFKCHVFSTSPKALVLQAIDGGQVLDRKQTFQFFETPQYLAERMVELAEIAPGMLVLEPSAGRGAIVRAINEHAPKAIVTAIDLDPEHEKHWDALQLAVTSVGDFLEERDAMYDRILMNPPFTRGQDIDHVRHAYTLLKPGGRLVAIMSTGPSFRQDKKSAEFREWLDEVPVDHEEELPPGTFEGSGTKVSTKLIVLHKPEADGGSALGGAAFAEEPPILDAKDIDLSEREMFAADQLDALARMGEKPKRVKHVLPLLGVGFLGLTEPGRHPSVVLGTTVVRGQECLRLGLPNRAEDWSILGTAPVTGKEARDRVVNGTFTGIRVIACNCDHVIGDVFHVRVGKGGANVHH